MASITTYSKRWQKPESEENMLKYKCLSAKTVNIVLQYIILSTRERDNLSRP